jgi:hypothetical protein
MRRLLALVLLLGLLVPASADALTRKQVFGIGDPHAPLMLNSKRLQALKPGSTRLNADWDVARTKGYERLRVDTWYASALANNVKPLLSFQGYNRKKVPTVKQYTRAVKAAMKRWPAIKEFQVWNEANHDSQPAVYNHPERAARYAKAFDKVRCRGCTVVPITIIVSTSTRTQNWVRRWLRAYGKTPRIWALHTYGDVNRFTNERLAQFLAQHPRGRVWITETGGFAKFDTRWKYSLARQARAARFAFRQALKFRSRVDRMYWWEWLGQKHPRRAHWDTGLLSTSGKVRPAYKVALRERFRRR